jgi:hypothetical protein
MSEHKFYLSLRSNKADGKGNQVKLDIEKKASDTLKRLGLKRDKSAITASHVEMIWSNELAIGMERIREEIQNALPEIEIFISTETKDRDAFIF